MDKFKRMRKQMQEEREELKWFLVFCVGMMFFAISIAACTKTTFAAEANDDIIAEINTKEDGVYDPGIGVFVNVIDCAPTDGASVSSDAGTETADDSVKLADEAHAEPEQGQNDEVAEEVIEDEPIYGEIKMSEEEEKLLRSILALEADYDTEGFDGQKAVVEVIFNRVLSNEWPNTVKEVIYQKGQFATVKYLKKPYNLPGEHEDDAISAVLRETSLVLPSTDYVFFSRGKSNGKDFVRLNHHWFSR